MPEPKDKLDTSVNGPEDPRPVFPAFDGDAWERVDWRRCEEEVRRLRSRIFKAVQERDMATAVDLQKLMLRSWHNTLASVRQVTQRNTGRKTAGIDGLVALTSQARAEMAVRVHATRGSHQPSPVRRVYIPKASDKTKMRPLGIPVILDRCHQARVRNALEPEWEARFEPRSYGFRPGRGCHDAIGSLFNTLRGKAKRVWILDADLAGAFDKIDHEHLLNAIGGFPARGMIAGWLRAGIFEAGKGYSPTEEGTPQGGVISPLLLNIALHGLEEAAGVRYRTGSHAREFKAGSPALTRYADDLVVCCHSRQDAEQVKARLAEWLEPRGLAFNEAKTRIVPVTEGFDFLGFNLRRYPNGKLLIKPSATAIKRFRDRLAKEFRSLRGTNVAAVLAKIAPIVRGWVASAEPVGLEYTIVAVTCVFWYQLELSGGDLVLVRKPAEDLLSADPVLSEVDLRWSGAGLSGCELAEGTVRPGGVVMPQVLGQHPAQVVLIDDQQPIEEFPAQGADDPFADRVRSGRLRRAGENPDACRREDGVEGAGELACAIPDQELDCIRACAEVHQEVAGCLCRPRAVRVRGDAGQVRRGGCRAR